MTSQDGDKKQDCEQKIASCWLDKQASKIKELRHIFLRGDFFTYKLFHEKILRFEFSFIFRCSLSSYNILQENLFRVKSNGLPLCKLIPGKGWKEYRYKWLEGILIRYDENYLKVN